MIATNQLRSLRTAISGIGGFGAAHHGVFAKLEKLGLVRVVATCDPALDQLTKVCQTHGFAERGIDTFKAFEDMLDAQLSHLDLGVVAAPVALHGRMHKAFIQNGTACYLEKPPTLDPQEFAQMLAVEESALFPTNVGFAYIHLQDRLDLKRRIMSGEFGAMKRLSFLGLAQRSPSYFQRNNWAGKLTLGENLVLDSCLGNALAHFVNNLLFFANLKLLHGWARPVTMACELYRANSIESTDTIFALARLDNGVELRIAAMLSLLEIPFRSGTITQRMLSHDRDSKYRADDPLANNLSKTTHASGFNKIQLTTQGKIVLTNKTGDALKFLQCRADRFVGYYMLARF